MADVFKTIKVTQATPGGPLQEQLVGAVSATSGIADANKVILTDASGMLDGSFGGGGGSSLSVNGTPVSNPNLVDSASVTWSFVGSNISAMAVSGSVSFAAITTGSNTTATMTVGTGGTVTFTGTGVVNANLVGGINAAGNSPTHAGMLLISQPGNTTALWADPQVQGLYDAGAQISPAPAYVAPTNIQPVMIGGSDYAGTAHLQTWKVDATGLGYISGTVAVSSITNPVTVTGTIAATQSGTWNIGTVSAVTSVTNPVAVTQSTSPWVVSGTVTANQGTSPWVVSLSSTTITGTVAVTQSTSPWVVSGTVTANAGTGDFSVVQTTAANLNATVVGTGTFGVQAAQSGSWNVGVTGTVAVTQSTSPWVVSLSSTTITGTVSVTQGTSPWVVSNSGTFAVQATQAGSWTSTVTQGTAANLNATVVGTGTFAVQATQSGTWNIGTLTSITNPVTVTGTVAATQSGSWTATVTQTTAANLNATVVGTGTFAVQATQSGTWNIGTVTSITNAVTVTGTVAATQSGTWTSTVTQATAANLNATVVGTGTFAVQAAQSGTWVVNNPSSTTASSPSVQTVGITSGSILAANAARFELTVVNTGTTTIYICLGAANTPTVTAYHVALTACASANDGSGGTYTSDLWKGAINAISSAAGGTVVVTEIS